ncbi:MAG TPA: ABC transporter permease, partial [Candidatus Sulfotelmatobacter sp.]|nr:ABC transporter permease [Candidatus Sulfotelmatobacter sp.]
MVQTESASVPFLAGRDARSRRAVPGASYVLALLILVFGIFAPGFLSVSNLLNVSRQAAVLLIVAVGQTLIILTEGIDLSSGAVMGLAGVSCGVALHAGSGAATAIVLALLVGILCGALSGWLITAGRLPPFIATLGMMGMAQGLALALSHGSSVRGFTATFRYLADESLLGVPIPGWIALLTFAWGYLLLYHTPLGTHVLALGGNREAARATGVPILRQEFRVYALAGLLSALGGIVLVARINSAHPTVGIGYEFDAIAAAILGGTSFERGRGGLPGTILGVALIAVLRNGLNVIGMATYLQLAAVGA